MGVSKFRPVQINDGNRKRDVNCIKIPVEFDLGGSALSFGQIYDLAYLPSDVLVTKAYVVITEAFDASGQTVTPQIDFGFADDIDAFVANADAASLATVAGSGAALDTYQTAKKTVSFQVKDTDGTAYTGALTAGKAFLMLEVHDYSRKIGEYLPDS